MTHGAYNAKLINTMVTRAVYLNLYVAFELSTTNHNERHVCLV